MMRVRTAYLIIIAAAFLPPVMAQGQYATPVLWRDPGNIAARDLYYGPGGRDAAADLQRKLITVKLGKDIKDEKVATDERGRLWSYLDYVEPDPPDVPVNSRKQEGMAEIAASRLLWAVGYHAQQMTMAYFAKVEGAGRRSQLNGRRLKRLDTPLVDLFGWDVKDDEDSPFQGTRELEGLRGLLALLGLREAPNGWLQVAQDPANPGTQIYYVANLRNTLGGGDKPQEDYAKLKPFLQKPANGAVAFRGKAGSLLGPVRIESARWIGGLLSRLSDDQLTSAFKAGGYQNADVLETYRKTVRARIAELVTAGAATTIGQE